MDLQLLWNQYGVWLTAACAVLIAPVPLMYWGNRAKLKRVESQMDIIKDILRNVNPDKGLEENLDRILEMISYLIEVPTYTFYVLDRKGQSYLLKAVRYQSQDFGAVRPSYSGLVSFQQGSYMPPLSIPVSKRVYEVKKVEEGDIPLFYVPVGEKGLLIIGPLQEIKKENRMNLEVVGEQLQYLLNGLIVSEETRSQAQVVVASGKALHKISNISMDWKTMMEMMIKLCMQSIHASGGFLVQRADDGYEITLQVGLDKDVIQSLKSDPYTLRELHSYIASKDYFFIRRSDELFYQLPPYFAATGMETLTLVRLDAWQDSFLVLWFEEGKAKQEDEISMILNTMIEHVRSVIGHQAGLRQFTNVYLDILKMLVRLIDNLNPYTVGYSELMSRYSVAIARQLQLNEDEIKDVALAAYLSNIGVLGLSTSLFEKEGKYTDEEFELMKLHCEVGASIVTVATGNERVASYIMHHHERMDGNGYPFGLKDEEIPVGAKILAVVQTFLAKTCGRKYREPLPFNQAIGLLRSSAGAQLDESIVNTFIDWYKMKRLDPAVAGRAMGSCSQILCVPAGICSACPAYGRKDIPCWEVENNLCRAHGKDCNSCMVRTEFLTRNEWRS
jgi:HD-GYP domain-containing protein (c-di-GMP phosphodiesterase class II)